MAETYGHVAVVDRLRDVLRERLAAARAAVGETFCHFTDTPWLSLLKHLIEVHGGCR